MDRCSQGGDKMKNKQKTPRLTKGNGVNSKAKYNTYDISTYAQKQRLLTELRIKPITTIQARSELNILAPAARIWELRHIEGHNITMHLVKDVTTEGKQHRVAQYSLINGKWRSNKLCRGCKNANT